MNAALREHWQTVYRDKGEAQTSWFRAQKSLALMHLRLLTTA